MTGPVVHVSRTPAGQWRAFLPVEGTPDWIAPCRCASTIMESKARESSSIVHATNAVSQGAGVAENAHIHHAEDRDIRFRDNHGRNCSPVTHASHNNQ